MDWKGKINSTEMNSILIYKFWSTSGSAELNKRSLDRSTEIFYSARTFAAMSLNFMIHCY